jgi:acetyltransferase-like isoleucine patch superfamily enzyme
MGINVSTMPGVIIGQGSVVGPSTTVTKNVPEETLVYSKQEIVIKKLVKNI